jgi:predicted dienelactone hydrolase
VLSAIGARPDLRLIGPHCQKAPEFVCKVLKQAGSPLLAADSAWPGEPLESPGRIKAAVVAAPGLGFAFGAQGLAGVTVPVQLWSGERDPIAPFETNARLIKQGLGSAVDFHAVPRAGHTSFLTPCRLLRPPALCADPDGFDRESFHQSMNESVVQFFNARLRRP